MQQLNELNAIAAELDRVTKGMLEGQVTRDDGLFATAAALQRLVSEFTQFVSYSLPIVHTMHKAMLAAQAQQAQVPQPQPFAPQQQQAFAPQQQGQVVQALQPQGQPAFASQQQPQPQAELPANVVPINPSTGGIQVVSGVPAGGQP